LKSWNEVAEFTANDCSFNPIPEQMTVRRQLATALALAALLAGGCGGGDREPLGAETDDANYRLGKKLQMQGRDAEALTAFLKTIETRGERNAPESHLEAGNIYLQHAQDPVEAIHHLKKFLELEPNAREATLVRDRINTAKREFSRTLAARPLDAMPTTAQSDELDTLRRENAELRAENATLRGGGAAYPARSIRTITLPAADTAANAPTAPAPERTPISPAPTPTPLPPQTQTAARTSPIQPVPAPPPARQSTSSAAAPSRPAASGHTHTVAEHESLWAIARRYYGPSPTGAQVRGIYEANRNVMKTESDLRPGMTLRIP